jgi:hypothetical protein
MGVIRLSDRSSGTWCVAGWAFRQILDDVGHHYPKDFEMIEKFEQSKLHSGLSLYLLDPALAERIKSAMSHVINGILGGRIQSGIAEQPYGDATTTQQYLESLRELSHILDEAN